MRLIRLMMIRSQATLPLMATAHVINFNRLNVQFVDLAVVKQKEQRSST
jgi:hypothetical protein